MQSPIVQPQSGDPTNGYLHVMSVYTDSDGALSDESTANVTEPIRFHSHFVDHMDLYADADTVARYFDDHRAWFERCAQPMKVESIGKNAYALVVGRYGAAGFELEPRIGLDLLPQENKVYRIETVPVPGYEPIGYQVDFKAAMELAEVESGEVLVAANNGNHPIEKITRVNWTLELIVDIQFPRFIHAALPKSLILGTGDQLLKQVVRQVSRRLTRKVQDDFCRTYEIELPKRQRRWFFQKQEIADPAGEEA